MEGLTDGLRGVDALVLPGDGVARVHLGRVLHEGVALVHRDADDASIALEHALHVVLGQRERVEIADEYPRVDGVRIVGVGYVADFAHPHV